MKYLFITICCCALFIASCANNEKKQTSTPFQQNKDKDVLASFSWVLGDWNNINTQTESFEHWERETDTSMVGYSITLRKQDTVFFEQMRIYQENDIIKLYVETVGENPNPVVFTQKKEAEHPFTFENPRNEFPSQIVYTNPEPKKIKAWVAGFIDSIPQRQEFYFVKTE